VLRSTDEKRPEVQEEYLICKVLGIGENIDPGNFAGYKWYLENQFVADSPTYKPTEIGEYSLTVTSEENCDYTTTFTVADECDLAVVVPTAIVAGDPNRSFLIYSSKSVEEVELVVYGKWGDVLFHCKTENIQVGIGACTWDGTFRGQSLPGGTYPLKVIYRNLKYGVSQSLSTSLMIID
jgi:hypothetical protein